MKPENVLMSEGIALVADFGIARSLSNPASNASQVTSSDASGSLLVEAMTGLDAPPTSSSEVLGADGAGS